MPPDPSFLLPYVPELPDLPPPSPSLASLSIAAAVICWTVCYHNSSCSLYLLSNAYMRKQFSYIWVVVFVLADGTERDVTGQDRTGHDRMRQNTAGQDATGTDTTRQEHIRRDGQDVT